MNKRLVTSAFAFLLALLGLLMPIASTGRIVRSLGDLVHAPLFAALTWLFLAVLDAASPIGHQRGPWVKRCFLVFVVGTIFGIAIEILQKLSGRSASVHDAIADCLGIAAAIAIASALRFKRSSFVWIAAACFFMASFGPTQVLLDVWAVQRDFPLLASFESEVELERFYSRRCDLSLTDQDVTHGSHALQVDYRPGPYPAATMIDLFGDWSTMESLELDVTPMGEPTDAPVTFMLKVIDRLRTDDHRDTFRKQWELKPGTTHHLSVTRKELLAGPDRRALDLSQIRFIDLMLLDPKQPISVRFDALRIQR